MTTTISTLTTALGNPVDDLFGRRRVSNPIGVFDSQQSINNDPHFMTDTVVGSATATWSADEARTRLQCTATSGDKATRESKFYVPYQPGRAQQVFITFVMSAAATNNEKRVGYFDDNNGFFLEQHSSGIRLVKRADTTGSIVDTEVEQASWNIDPLDGSGPSGLTIDVTKIQLMQVDLGWLSAAGSRVRFLIGDEWVTAHQFSYANTATTAYMGQASLPVRWEIENTGASSGTPYLDAVCVSVFSEGGSDPLGIAHSYSTVRVSTTATTVNSGIRAAIASVKLGSGISDVVFSGAGLDDATSGGTYTGDTRDEYVVVIDGTGTPDTFSWTVNGGGGASGVAITGGAQALSQGVTITFAATTGHTLSDQWTITATPEAYSRALYQPITFSVSTDSAAAFLVELTSGGTGTFTSGTTTYTGEITEFISQGAGPISSSNISGDDVIMSFVVNSANNSTKDSGLIVPTHEYFGNSTYVNVVVTPLGAAENFHASITWREVY